MIIEDLTDLQLIESALVHYRNNRARGARAVAQCDMLIDTIAAEVVEIVSQDY